MQRVIRLLTQNHFQIHEAFWAEHGKRIDWIQPYTKVSDVSYDKPDVHIKWYEDGTLNASANCLDRHLETRGE